MHRCSGNFSFLPIVSVMFNRKLRRTNRIDLIIVALTGVLAGQYTVYPLIMEAKAKAKEEQKRKDEEAEKQSDATKTEEKFE